MPDIAKCHGMTHEGQIVRLCADCYRRTSAASDRQVYIAPPARRFGTSWRCSMWMAEPKGANHA